MGVTAEKLEYLRLRQAKKRAAGICRYCSSPAVPDHAFCQRCLDRRNAQYSRKRDAERAERMKRAKEWLKQRRFRPQATSDLTPPERLHAALRRHRNNGRRYWEIFDRAMDEAVAHLPPEERRGWKAAWRSQRYIWERCYERVGPGPLPHYRHLNLDAFVDEPPLVQNSRYLLIA